MHCIDTAKLSSNFMKRTSSLRFLVTCTWRLWACCVTELEVWNCWVYIFASLNCLCRFWLNSALRKIFGNVSLFTQFFIIFITFWTLISSRRPCCSRYKWFMSVDPSMRYAGNVTAYSNPSHISWKWGIRAKSLNKIYCQWDPKKTQPEGKQRPLKFQS